VTKTQQRISQESVRAGFKSSGLLNPVTGANLPTSYSFVAREALADPALFKLLQSRIPVLTKANLEQELSKISISSLRSTVSSVATDLGKKSGAEFLTKFDDITYEFRQLAVSALSHPVKRVVLKTVEGGVKGAASIGTINAGIAALTPKNWEDGFGAVIDRSLKSFYQGAILGLGIGGVISGIANVFSRTAANSRIVAADEIRSRLTMTRRSGVDLYDKKIIKEALDENGVLYEANFRMAKAATRKSYWPVDWYREARAAYANHLITSASPKTRASWSIHDSSLAKTALKPADLLILTGKTTEPVTRIQRAIFELKIAYHGRWWGNMNMTAHQAGVANTIASKAPGEFFSKLDVMQLRRLGQTGSPAIDAFSRRYGFWAPSNTPIAEFKFATAPAQDVWSRVAAVAPNYAKVIKPFTWFGRLKTIGLATVTLGAGMPRASPISAAGDLRSPDRIEMALGAENNLGKSTLANNSAKGEAQVAKQPGMSGYSRVSESGIRASSKAGEARNPIEYSKVKIAKAADSVKAVKTANLDQAKVVSSDLSNSLAKSPFFVRAEQTIKDQDQIRYHQKQIQEQQQQIQNLRQIHEQQQMKVANTVTTTAKKPAATKPVPIVADFGFEETKKEKKKKEQIDLALTEDRKVARMKEEEALAASKGVDHHLRALRKIIINGLFGKSVVALQRQKDDFQWETLSEREIITGKPDAGLLTGKKDRDGKDLV